MPPSGKQGDVKDILIGIAITGVIFICALYIPHIGAANFIIIPLPTLFYRLKLGRNIGMAIPFISMALIFAILKKMSFDFFFLTELMLIGFALGEFIEKDFSIEKTFLYTCGVVIGMTIFILMFYSNILGKNPIVLISDYVAKNLNLTLSMYKKMGIPQDSIYMLENSLKYIKYILIRILPALIIVASLFITWINILIVRPILINNKLKTPDFGILKHWKSPEFLVWPVIACGFLLIISNQSLKLIAINCLIILMTIYFFQGMAIISFFFEKKGFSPILKICLYSLIFIQQILVFPIIGLGFFDMWINFRNLEKIS